MKINPRRHKYIFIKNILHAVFHAAFGLGVASHPNVTEYAFEPLSLLELEKLVKAAAMWCALTAVKWATSGQWGCSNIVICMEFGQVTLEEHGGRGGEGEGGGGSIPQIARGIWTFSNRLSETSATKIAEISLQCWWVLSVIVSQISLSCLRKIFDFWHLSRGASAKFLKGVDGWYVWVPPMAPPAGARLPSKICWPPQFQIEEYIPYVNHLKSVFFKIIGFVYISFTAHCKNK